MRTSIPLFLFGLLCGAAGCPAPGADAYTDTIDTAGCPPGVFDSSLFDAACFSEED